MRHLWILLAVLGFIGSAKAMDLGEYLMEVRKANPTLLSFQRRARSLEYRIKPASTVDDPFVAAGIDEVPFDGSGGSVSRYQLSQTIPFPGKLGAKAKIAENKAKSAQSDFETMQREIAVLATQVFYRAFYNYKSLELNEKLINLIKATVESVKARYKTGESEHHEWLLGRVELSVIEVERLKLMREQKTVHALMNELRDQPAESSIGALSVQFLNDEPKINEILIFENQPELKSLQYLVTQAQQEKRLSKLTYFPDFVLQGMAMYPSSEMMDEKSSWGVMIGISLPLYFWRKQSELVSAVAMDEEIALLEKRSIENRLKTEFLDAKEQFKTAKNVVTLYRDSVIPATNLAVQNAKSGYARRRFPLRQYLDILKTQRTQELEYLAAQIDMELARTRLKELLSSPPILRFAPSKPSLFGGSAMAGSAMGSETVNMGGAMAEPARKPKTSSEKNETGDSGMGNM